MAGKPVGLAGASIRAPLVDNGCAYQMQLVARLLLYMVGCISSDVCIADVDGVDGAGKHPCLMYFKSSWGCTHARVQCSAPTVAHGMFEHAW
jgi:hypothetical protein